MMSCFFFLMILRPPRTTRTDTRFPYTTLFRSLGIPLVGGHYAAAAVDIARPSLAHRPLPGGMAQLQSYDAVVIDTVASLGASAFMRSEEHTSELQSLMRISYAVFCLKKKTTIHTTLTISNNTHNEHRQTT